MGITIYYSGKIKDINLIPELIDGLRAVSNIAGWKYNIIDDQPRIYGIALDVHPKCETVLVTFDKEGTLGYIYEHKDKDGNPRTAEAHSLSVKTQYAGERVHIAVIELLKYIKNKYIPDLDVEDDGDYWDKEDRESLRVNFDRVRVAIDGLGNALDDHAAGKKADPSYSQIIKTIERAINVGHHVEYDIDENDNYGINIDEEYELSDEEAVWTEEQWEEHFKENEKLMDKYEQVHKENPGRHWEHPYDLYCKVHYGIDFGKDFSFAQLQEGDDVLMPELDGGNEESRITDISKEYENERKTFPILEESFEYSRAVIEFAKSFEGDHMTQEALSKYIYASLQISAKLHGAHAMGYEKDSLEGNIAVCKIALKNADLALVALTDLKLSVRDLISFAKLDEKILQLRTHTEEWIADLRGRVWWR
jgi:hypothetical protein